MNTAPDSVSRPESFGQTFRNFTWAHTQLGERREWSKELQSMVDLILAAAQPMFILWGDQRILLHNEAYARLIDRRHPATLGRAFFEVWPEARGALESLFERVFAGKAVASDDSAGPLLLAGHPLALSFLPVIRWPISLAHTRRCTIHRERPLVSCVCVPNPLTPDHA